MYRLRVVSLQGDGLKLSMWRITSISTHILQMP